MTPAEIGPSAGGNPKTGESTGGSRAFENSPFTQILETVPFGLFVLDGNGTPVYSNLRAAQILGKGLSGDADLAHLAETYAAYLAGTDSLYPVERMPIVRALAGEHSTVSDMEIRHPDGSRYLEVTGAPVLDSNHRVKYAVAVFHDITVSRSVESALRLLADELTAHARERSEQLESMNRQLVPGTESAASGTDRSLAPAEDDTLIEPCGRCFIFREVEQARESAALANRALTLFIANFSHELRTPLNHIMGFSDLIETNIQRGVTEDIDKHAQNIRRSGASLLETLNKIITVAEAESSALGLSLEILDPTQILRDISAKFSPVAEHNGNRFELLIDGELGLVQTDAARVRAALDQIVENACKHCRAGSVTVNASRTAPGTDGSIEVVVSDTGHGIDPIRGAMLVDGKVMPGDSLLDAGLGIGIPLAVQSLRALGGSLSFTTEPSGGTRFVVTFPTYTRA